MKIYVSNIGCHVTGADLYQLFAGIGNVASAHIITDKETGKSLRYGFVEMTDGKSGHEAIGRLHGKVIEGRTLSVTIAKEKSGEEVKSSPKRSGAISPQVRRLL